MSGQKAHKTQQITLFHPTKGGLSLTLTIHRQTYNPNSNPSIYPMELWGLVGMVAPTAPTTQQKVLIGLFPKNEFFHCHDADIYNSVPV